MKSVLINPKISIIIPVYNVEKYLPTCLQSCISQTLYDIEILCVDDGSTDASLSILKTFAKIDSRITVIKKENGGLSSARNAGLEEASGDIIMFLDSDDYLIEHACERVYVEFQEGPTDIVVFSTSIVPSYPKPEQWYPWILTVSSKRYTSFTDKVLFKQIGAVPFVWRQAFSRQILIDSNVKFSELIKYGEDVIFQLQIFPHSKTVSFIGDVLYCYRWYRDDSLMSKASKSPDYKVSQLTTCVQEIVSYWQDQKWFELYGKSFLRWMLRYIVPEILLLNGDSKATYQKKIIDLIETYNLLQFKNKADREQKFLLKKLYAKSTATK